jgi:hypothetical protein
MSGKTIFVGPPTTIEAWFDQADNQALRSAHIVRIIRFNTTPNDNGGFMAWHGWFMATRTLPAILRRISVDLHM